MAKGAIMTTDGLESGRQSNQGHGRQRLQGHLRSEFAEAPLIGDLDGATQLHLAIALPLRNPSQLDNLLQEVSDPKSAQFRQYLTPAQFAEQFSPTDQDHQGLAAFIERTEGLTITHTHANGVVLDISGTASAIQDAFHIKLNTRLRPDGSTFYAPDSEPSLDLDTPVLHVTGLDNYTLPRAHAGSGPNGEFGGSDFRSAYAPGVTLTGQGQTVGLFQLDGFFTADPNAYNAKFGMNVPVQVVTLPGFSQSPTQSGPNGTPVNDVEVALDIEMAMAMAPGLQSVVVYEGSNVDSVLAAMASPPSGVPLSLQLSASYTFGTTAASQQSVNQMAAQGQTFFVVAGDGRALCPTEIGQGSRALSYVTVVGGTNLSLALVDGVLSWESEISASNGGGVQTNVPIPGYQLGLATAANGGSNKWRNIPDVSLVSNNVFIFSNNVVPGATGGTSAATPLWAGYMALANQQAQLDGQHPLGFINPIIYTIGRMPPVYARDFHDIQSGGSQKSSPPCPGYIGYNATVGYDLASGWGTPTSALINDLVHPPSPSILASLFQAAEALPVPEPGVEQVQIQVLFTIQGSGVSYSNIPLPSQVESPGILLYTPAREVRLGMEIFLEPAFFSGSNSAGSSEVTITLTAPRLDGPINYNVAVTTPSLHGNFTPVAIETVSGIYFVYGDFPGAVVTMTLTDPISVQF